MMSHRLRDSFGDVSCAMIESVLYYVIIFFVLVLYVCIHIYILGLILIFVRWNILHVAIFTTGSGLELVR